MTKSGHISISVGLIIESLGLLREYAKVSRFVKTQGLLFIPISMPMKSIPLMPVQTHWLYRLVNIPMTQIPWILVIRGGCNHALCCSLQINSTSPTRWCPSSLAKLVNISTISLGLMNGGYIELVIGIINQQTSLGGHHLAVTMQSPYKRINW